MLTIAVAECSIRPTTCSPDTGCTCFANQLRRPLGCKGMAECAVLLAVVDRLCGLEAVQAVILRSAGVGAAATNTSTNTLSKTSLSFLVTAIMVTATAIEQMQKPMCHNCVKRASLFYLIAYDAVAAVVTFFMRHHFGLA